jgi:magnesium-transporting ATPase (P-type)
MKHFFTGLTEQQVLENRKRYGANILTPPKRESLWKLFLDKFRDPIIRILLIAAFLSLIVSFVHNEYSETIGIFFAIFLATGVGFWFEVDAQKKFDVLNQVNDETAVKVIRNANISEITKREIVVGDIVLLGTGEEVPADGKLLEAISLQINESTLTGDPVVDKTTNEANFDDEATYPFNMIYRGITVVDGHCTMEVVTVGDYYTEFGKVAREASKMTEEATPLNKQLQGLARVISDVGFSLGILTFIVLFLENIFRNGEYYSCTQLIFLGITILSIAVILTKIWLPIAYDTISLICKKEKSNKRILDSNWFRWIGLGVTQMLWVNLIMDTFAAGALASLPPNPKVMKEKPRKNSDFIITREMGIHIFVTGLLFIAFLFGLLFYFTDSTGSIGLYYLSVFFTVFVLLQFWNLFNTKAFDTTKSAFYKIEKSYGFITVAVCILAGQFLIVTFGREVFRTISISWYDWLWIVGGTSSVLWTGEFVRFIRSVFPEKREIVTG